MFSKVFVYADGVIRTSETNDRNILLCLSEYLITVVEWTKLEYSRLRPREFHRKLLTMDKDTDRQTDR